MDRLLLVIVVAVVAGCIAVLAGDGSRDPHAPQAAIGALQATEPAGGAWYRTTRGWEHSSQWQAAGYHGAGARRVTPNPVVVGLLQLLLSLGALVAFSPERTQGFANR